MEVVLCPVNDEFLTDVVFPAFEQRNGSRAVRELLKQVDDAPLRSQLELLVELGFEGSMLDARERWSQACYRLLFQRWKRAPRGWAPSHEAGNYAGPWEETLHLALMLENDRYPYANDDQSRQRRRAFYERPDAKFEISSFLCGQWETAPAFDVGQVLALPGEPESWGAFPRASWTFRALETINLWAAQLPNMLSRLLEQEEKRLRPLEIPEKHEVLDFWLGRSIEPPVLAVSFSGLGPRSNAWIAQVGALARLIRSTAADDLGLTLVVSHPRNTAE